MYSAKNNEVASHAKIGPKNSTIDMSQKQSFPQALRYLGCLSRPEGHVQGNSG